MTEQQKQNLTIKFGDCDAGWILMRLSNGESSLVVRMSHWLDPLPGMLAWLEAISIGVEECGFRVDREEGDFLKQWELSSTFRPVSSLAQVMYILHLRSSK
jgi:hypothetical protein